MQLKTTIPALALAGLAACAGLSTEERAAACAETDWYQFGLTDGTFGVATARRQDRFQQCADVGLPPDVAAYQDGHARGLQDYCTEPSGYQVAYDGKEYEGVCPPHLEPVFLAGYQRGEEDRPSLALRPTIGVGVGIGTGGIRPHVGIGLFSGCFLFC